MAQTDSPTNIHGPILTWNSDPTTSMTVTWLESASSDADARPNPVSSNTQWRTGESGFGYGDNDDETTLSNMEDNFGRVYIRKVFSIKDVSAESAELRIRYDDGFIAYLNGHEVIREKVKSGTGASAKEVGKHEADAEEFTKFKIENWSRLAKPGNNVLAIEGHNCELDSTDFTLDAFLVSAESEDLQLVARKASWDYLAGRDPKVGWTNLDFEVVRSANPKTPSETTLPKTTLPKETQSENRAAKANRIFYRSLGSEKWISVSGSRRSFGDTKDIVRTVQLAYLQPNTDYEFLLGGRPMREADIMKFRTAATDFENGMSFVTGGDMSVSETAQAMNRLAGKLDPTFALLGGDLAYANGKNAKLWHQWLDNWTNNAVTKDGRMVPMVVVVGNHETGSKLSDKVAQRLGVPKNSQFFYSLFTLPNGRSNYVMNFGDYLSLFVLDSDHTQPVVDQTPWLDHALQQHAAFPFRMVCYHRPAYGTAKVPNKNIIKHWVPLFEKHKITVVFENDHHTVKRTHRLTNGKKDPNGVLYLGDGSWGVKCRSIDEDKRGYLAYAEGKNHLWHVTLTDEGAQYAALTKDGVVLDKCTTK